MLWRIIEAGFEPTILIYDKLIALVFVCGAVLLVSRIQENKNSGLIFKLIVTLASMAIYAGVLLGLTQSSDLHEGLVIKNQYLAGGFIFAIGLHLYSKYSEGSSNQS